MNLIHDNYYGFGFARQTRDMTNAAEVEASKNSYSGYWSPIHAHTHSLCCCVFILYPVSIILKEHVKANGNGMRKDAALFCVEKRRWRPLCATVSTKKKKKKKNQRKFFLVMKSKVTRYDFQFNTLLSSFCATLASDAILFFLHLSFLLAVAERHISPSFNAIFMNHCCWGTPRAQF